MSEIKARDCLPFENENDKAIRKLCDYFASTVSGIDDNERIAYLRTSLWATDRQPAAIQTRWWAGRYIGLAKIAIPRGSGFSWYDISIRPRFGENFLLALIEDVYNIKTPKQDATSQTSYSNEWFSALLRLLRRKMWIDKCAKANRYGLPRKTVKREHKGVVLHGAIDVRRTTQSWMFDKEISTYTYEKEMDEQIGKILYEANKILTKEAITFQLRKKTKTTPKDNKNSVLGFSLPPVVQDTINLLNSQYKGVIFDIRENDYRRIRYKSIYQSWKPLVDFSWDIISGKQLRFNASESITDCIFIDMAEIWEAFLRKKLGEAFSSDGWRVLSVEECHYGIYQDSFFKREIIPDIILQKGDEYIVFDAKYKRMLGRKEDVDRTDLFQIHTYIQYVERCMGEVVLAGLLYPITGDTVNENIYHSDNLFGHPNGHPNDEKIPFIIDGIYCKEMDNDILYKNSIESQKEIIEKNVAAMITRIKKILEK